MTEHAQSMRQPSQMLPEDHGRLNDSADDPNEHLQKTSYPNTPPQNAPALRAVLPLLEAWLEQLPRKEHPSPKEMAVWSGAS